MCDLVAEVPELGSTVYTEMGKGKVVFLFPDQSFAVQLDFGGGCVLHSFQCLAVTKPELSSPIRRMPHRMSA